MANRIPYTRHNTGSDTKKLRFQYEALDKTAAHLSKALKSDELKVFLDKLKQESYARHIKTNNTIQELRNSLKTLNEKSLVFDLDMDNMRDFLFKITDDLTSLKDTSVESLEELLAKEKQYRADLGGLEKRVDEIKESVVNIKPGKSLPWIRTKPIRSELVIPKKSYEETEAFDKFLLRNGGHTGGWDEADHLLFLKHFAKHKGEQLADTLHAVLPDIPPQVIQDHETWYTQYITLKAEQKEAIKRWREKQKKVVAETKDETLPIQELPQPRVDAAVSAEKIAEKKQQIMQWKLKRDGQKILEVRQRQLIELQQAEAHSRKTEKDHEQQRRALQVYQERKRAEEMAKRATRDLEVERKGSATDGRLIKMFRERDREIVANTLRRIEQENTDKAARASVRRKPKTLAAVRDPGRLLQPTEVWRHRLQQRLEDPNHSIAKQSVLHLNNLPRLKVPSWRKLAA